MVFIQYHTWSIDISFEIWSADLFELSFSNVYFILSTWLNDASIAAVQFIHIFFRFYCQYFDTICPQITVVLDLCVCIVRSIHHSHHIRAHQLTWNLNIRSLAEQAAAWLRMCVHTSTRVRSTVWMNESDWFVNMIKSREEEKMLCTWYATMDCRSIIEWHWFFSYVIE